MKILNKFIWSKTEPKNKNDVWFDGSVFRLFKEEEWQAFTLPVDIAEKIAEAESIPLVNVTYNELKTLRNSKKLIPGMQYRIIDYKTTTIQENTYSANNQFDVIVIADNDDTLNEVARACLHDGDTYFSDAGANLSAWKVWYCFDNDSTRYAWADKENGKGVIYRLVDEWGNDCPYDFKNIIFAKRASFKASGHYGPSLTNDYMYTGESKILNGITYYQCKRTDYIGPPLSEYVWTTSELPYLGMTLYSITDNTITSLSYSIIKVVSSSWTSLTFSSDYLKDDSLTNSTHQNIILGWVVDGVQKLNNNHFGGSCYNNYLGRDCYNNNFGDGCYNNYFEDGCYNNHFGDICYNNNFGSACYNNVFGYNCNNNSFCNSFTYNIFGDCCYSNSFGNNGYSNSFGNSCYSNSFGNSCQYISFGNECYSNSFGNYCSYISFNNSNGEVISYCSANRFGNDCHQVTLLNDSTSSSTNNLRNIRVVDGCFGLIKVNRSLPSSDWVIAIGGDSGTLMIKSYFEEL